jgi:hypothetical protein
MSIVTWKTEHRFTGPQTVGRVGSVAFFWITKESVTDRMAMENAVPGTRQRVTRYATEAEAKAAAEHFVQRFMDDTGFRF